MSDNYQASQLEGPIEIVDIDDLAIRASAVIPKGAFDYIAGGAGDEWTLIQNTKSFNHKGIVPRVMTGVENPVLKTKILGINIDTPLIMSPGAAQGLAHETADEGTARGVSASGTIMTVSTFANKTFKEVQIAGGGSPQWFQIYLSKNQDFNKHILDSAMEAGAKAIVLTLDATVSGNREADIRNDFTFPLTMPNIEGYVQAEGMSIEELLSDTLRKIKPSIIRKVAAYTKLPVIVKGIQAPEDALTAISHGASAIWVSNHGGRQLEGAPASFDVLESIAEAVNKKVPVIFDSGVRRGQHVFKAIASGADIVGLCRPVYYGLALGGWEGVKSVFDHINYELRIAMQLTGCKTVKDIQRAKLVTNRCSC
jgi:lactate oxidase